MKPCDLLLSEHDEDEGPCPDPAHQAALERRRAGAEPWSLLERVERFGDFRDHLNGEPIHCGEGLELQAQEIRTDDFGDYSIRLEKGIAVRYEVDWHPAGKRAVLYFDVFGLDFLKPIELSWMRFRFPVRRRR